MRRARRIATSLGFGLALLVAPGCDSDDSDDGDDMDDMGADDETDGSGEESGDPAELDCEESPVVTYDTFGRGFLSTYCNGCHGGDVEGAARQQAPPDVVFDDHEGAETFADRILARTMPEDGGAPTMPPAGGITPDDLARVEIWLECYP